MRAARLAPAADAGAAGEELRWQLDRLSPESRAALQKLPPLGTDRSGPLGPGLLVSGDLGDTIRMLQAAIEAARD